MRLLINLMVIGIRLSFNRYWHRSRKGRRGLRASRVARRREQGAGEGRWADDVGGLAAAQSDVKYSRQALRNPSVGQSPPVAAAATHPPPQHLAKLIRRRLSGAIFSNINFLPLLFRFDIHPPLLSLVHS